MRACNGGVRGGSYCTNHGPSARETGLDLGASVVVGLRKAHRRAEAEALANGRV